MWVQTEHAGDDEKQHMMFHWPNDRVIILISRFSLLVPYLSMLDNPDYQQENMTKFLLQQLLICGNHIIYIIIVGCLFSRATNVTDFVDFRDFHKIFFTENQRKFYRDMECRLNRRHQFRFMIVVSSKFLFNPFAKFIALEKVPYGIMQYA